MKVLGETSSFHWFTIPLLINRFIPGHGVVIYNLQNCDRNLNFEAIFTIFALKSPQRRIQDIV